MFELDKSVIKKYVFGKPFETNAVLCDMEISDGDPRHVRICEDVSRIVYKMGKNDRVYGLGESVKGINKRGWIYEMYCSDDPLHTETKRSLYGSHPFIIVDGAELFGLFVDYPERIVFDIGYSSVNDLEIKVGSPDYSLYIIEGETPDDIVKAFRALIGKSYIPPYWAFGFQQSRWSYYTSKDVQSVIDNYKDNGFPLDAVYLDIDYMESFKDFTISSERFPDFEELVKKAAGENVHLVPIIDAGVKIEDGYDVYEEGRDNNYFCKDENGEDFVAAVWPGKVCFPDFLNSRAAEWFGMKYKILTDLGIDGFWNDMNEPAVFYSEKGLDSAVDKIAALKGKNIGIYDFFDLKDTVLGLSNSAADYSAMYHSVDGETVCHDKVHNLFGFNMTKSASDAFKRIDPDKNILLFSRASYIGMHRYGGIWMGDNQSWWSHIKLNLQMLPSLNMCGFMYTGADLVGFGDHCTEELALRWLALGIFNPLMRNHSALGTRDQEFYRFENRDVFRDLLKLRYSLIPYLYSEFISSVEENGMMFRPLSFEYRNDRYACSVEDQLLVGGSIMIAPVYEPNAIGRGVYIPEDDMLAVHFRSCDDYDTRTYSKGYHFVEIPNNETVVFIRKDKALPIVEPADCTVNINMDTLKFIGEFTDKTEYTIYTETGAKNGESTYTKQTYSVSGSFKNGTVSFEKL